MIRSIGNTPAPTPAPVPAPEPTEGGNAGKNLAFKGVVIKNVPKNLEVSEFIDFLKAGEVVKELKGGNMRSRLANEDVFTWSLGAEHPINIMGLSKKAEDALYKDLEARKDALPGISIHKIDDWA